MKLTIERAYAVQRFSKIKYPKFLIVGILEFYFNDLWLWPKNRKSFKVDIMMLELRQNSDTENLTLCGTVFYHIILIVLSFVTATVCKIRRKNSPPSQHWNRKYHQAVRQSRLQIHLDSSRYPEHNFSFF